MAIGWMTVLGRVPWGDVVSNAPKVAAGAKNLWKAVATKPPPSRPVHSQPAPFAPNPELQAIAVLKSRVLELETATSDLQEQMADSTGLIRALAEQNTQLILRIDAMRARLIWTACAIGVLTALLGAAMAGIGFGFSSSR